MSSILADEAMLRPAPKKDKFIIPKVNGYDTDVIGDIHHRECLNIYTIHIVDNLMQIKSEPNSQKAGDGSTNQGAGSSRDMTASERNPKAENERSKKRSPDANSPKAGSSNTKKSKADKNNSSQRQRYHGKDRRMSMV